jgi:hypothetical protein
MSAGHYVRVWIGRAFFHTFEGELVVAPQLGRVVASDEDGGVVAGRGTVKVRVSDERVVRAKHRRIERCGVSTNLQSCGINKGLQSCQGHLAARCQA